MMIEVPAAAIMADVFAREAEFFSLGTNDLVQYALAIDRASRSLAALASPFDPGDPAADHAVVRRRRGARHRPVSLCGAMASDPLAAVPARRPRPPRSLDGGGGDPRDQGGASAASPSPRPRRSPRQALACDSAEAVEELVAGVRAAPLRPARRHDRRRLLRARDPGADDGRRHARPRTDAHDSRPRLSARTLAHRNLSPRSRLWWYEGPLHQDAPAGACSLRGTFHGLVSMGGRRGLVADVRPRFRWPALAGAAVAASLACAAPGCTSGGVGVQSPCPPGQTCDVHLTLLHTSDIHSRIFPYDLQILQVDSELGLGTLGQVKNVGGVARLSYLLNRERARADRVLHLDSGDISKGRPSSTSSRANPRHAPRA